jgi:hypothetical protein
MVAELLLLYISIDDDNAIDKPASLPLIIQSTNWSFKGKENGQAMTG